MAARVVARMTAPAPRLTAEMVPLLQRGAASLHGRICFPFESRKVGPLAVQMVAAGLAYWGGADMLDLFIREEGRRAVNGPSNAELLAVEMAEASA
jgi:hypothetical protein